MNTGLVEEQNKMVSLNFTGLVERCARALGLAGLLMLAACGGGEEASPASGTATAQPVQESPSDAVGPSRPLRVPGGIVVSEKPRDGIVVSEASVDTFGEETEDDENAKD